MKSIKLALLCGAALAVTTAGAKADELSDLKAQVESLNARVAAMETAPSVPAGYQLLAVSAGQMDNVPGMELSAHDRAVAGNKATVISVMPTADAPAGTTISWSGYVKAGLVYNDVTGDFKRRAYYNNGDEWVRTPSEDYSQSLDNNGDWDVKARGQLRVVAKTDTAVGEVGVELKMRADYNGTGSADIYMKTAWGYWAMTPELTFGGGYSSSLGDNGYDIDSNCTCGFIDNANSDAFDPGDTTQLRLTYASGPFSIAAAVEDGGKNDGFGEDNNNRNGDQLGAAGKIKYSGDAISGEISGVYRGINQDEYDNVDAMWQVNAGLGFGLGSMANLYLAASMGEGPLTSYDNYTGEILDTYDINSKWWGASAFGVVHLTDVVQAELGVGYKHQKGDNINNGDYYGEWTNIEWDQWSVLGGVYYNPVDQLTLGVEAEWFTTDAKATKTYDYETYRDKYEVNADNLTVDLVSIWRF